MEDDNRFVDSELLLQKMLEDPNLVQHITRTKESGCETIVGYFRVEFSPRQQRQVLHVPFAPPLKVVPKVDAHVTDHPDVRIRVTDTRKFGLRVEIILENPAPVPTNRLIEIIATEVV